ncbi:MAG: helix-turn-helix domain-containing protein, partial [Pseudomonadota bacterium]
TLGWDAAARIADNHVHDRMRGEDEVQHASAGYRFAGRATGLGGILTDMEAFIETPLSIAQLAERRKMSVRQLDRIFRKHLGVSPSEHYRELRLLRAAGLLRQSDLSVAEIAVACGFSSASHMNRYFAPRFGCTPTTHRRQHIQ